MPTRRWGKAKALEECTSTQTDVLLRASSPDGCTQDFSVGETFVIDAGGCARNVAGSDGRSSDGGNERRCHFKERGESHDVSLSLRDPLPTPSLAPEVVEYRLQLRAHWLRRQGWQRDDAAQKLSRSVGWVEGIWKQTADQLQRPRGVARYIATHEQRMLKAGVEPFKPPSLQRRYVDNCAGIYEQCAAAFPWEQAVLRKRNYDTGDVTITNIASSRQDCTFPTLSTGVARVDAAVERARRDLNIRDPGAYLMCNWYLDGNTNIAAHEHDFWSAILCFGASRVFLLDNKPLLLGDGDLLVFGTQKHSVPRMPDMKDGRISVGIFWYPERTQADGSFAITLDPLLAEAALSDSSLAEAIAEAAAAGASRIPLNLGGRGVGRRQDDAHGIDEDEPLSEDHIVAIALKLSLLEQ